METCMQNNKSEILDVYCFDIIFQKPETGQKSISSEKLGRLSDDITYMLNPYFSSKDKSLNRFCVKYFKNSLNKQAILSFYVGIKPEDNEDMGGLMASIDCGVGELLTNLDYNVTERGSLMKVGVKNIPLNFEAKVKKDFSSKKMKAVFC